MRHTLTTDWGKLYAYVLQDNQAHTITSIEEVNQEVVLKVKYPESNHITAYTVI